MPDADGIDDVTVAALGAADLDAVAAVHVAAFRDSALSRLGPRVVARFYAWRLSESADASLTGARDSSGALLGFVLSGSFVRSMDAFVLANAGRVALALAAHPGRFIDRFALGRLGLLVRTFASRLRRDVPTGTAATSRPPAYRVLSVAVHPEVEGRGVAKRLMAHVERAARASGITEMGLTVHRDNERAVRFYLQQGWVADDGRASAADLVLRRTLR